MKKISLVSTTVLVGLVLGTVGSTVQAETKEFPSEVTVTTVPTKDEEGTEVEGEDEDNEGTDDKGLLTLDNVSHIRFGEVEIKASTDLFPAINEGTIKTQVTDKRATGEGWKVAVKFDKDFKEVDGEHTLKGSILSLPKGTVTKVGENNSVAPEAFATTEINDADQIVLLASKDKGMGTWLNSMNQAETTLSIPGGSYAANYEATLEWTITDTPQ